MSEQNSGSAKKYYTDPNNIFAPMVEEAIRAHAKAQADAYIREKSEAYAEALNATQNQQIALISNPDQLKQVYAAARASDLNGDGILAGAEEQTALISNMTSLEFEPFQSEKSQLQEACAPGMDAQTVITLMKIGQHYYREYHVDKTLADTYKPDGSNIAQARQTYITEERTRRNMLGTHAALAPQGPLSDADYHALKQALDAMDKAKDTTVANHLMRSFTLYPDVQQAAQEMPKLGNLSPIPPQEACKAMERIRI